MLDGDSTLEESDWKMRSAEETLCFLNENFGPDDCDRLALIACMINVAIYERQPDDALHWSTVFARRERQPLTERTRRELQALLDDSRKWDV